MGLYFGDKKIGRIGITNGIGLDTSDADVTSINIQKGKIGYAQGKKVVGTAKCFEFAEYGLYKIEVVKDIDGIEKFGTRFEVSNGANTIFITSTTSGDILLQTTHRISLSEGKIKVGDNYTGKSEIFAFYDGQFFTIYLTEVEDENTMLRIFIGKDNDV